MVGNLQVWTVHQYQRPFSVPTDAHNYKIIFFPWRYTTQSGCYFTALYRALASSHTRLLEHTQRRATVGRTPLNE